MEATYFPEADTLKLALREFSVVSKRGREGQAAAADRLRAALHMVEEAAKDFEEHFIYPTAQRWGYLRLLTVGHAQCVRNFGGRFILPVTQRWGYLQLLTLVSAARTALKEMVLV